MLQNAARNGVLCSLFFTVYAISFAWTVLRFPISLLTTEVLIPDMCSMYLKLTCVAFILIARSANASEDVKLRKLSKVDLDEAKDESSYDKNVKNGKSHEKGHEERANSDELISKKSQSNNWEQCDAEKENCQYVNAKNKAMDDTADVIVESFKKYAKDFSEGKLDLKKLLESDYIKQLSQLMMHGNLPGGNPLIASAFQLFQKATGAFSGLQNNVEKNGLNLKVFVDEANALISQIIPGLVITLQHSDRRCRLPALCRAAHASVQSPHNLAKSLGLFLSSTTATFAEYAEKTKKGEYQKIVDCCSVADKSIFDKCSKKYMDEEKCSNHRMLNPKLLQNIDYSLLEPLRKFIPTMPFTSKK